MSRLLFVMPATIYLWEGGASRMTLLQKQSLERKGHTVDLLVDEPVDGESDWSENQILFNDENDPLNDLQYINSRFSDCLRSIEKLYPFSRKLVLTLKEKAYDIIVATDASVLPLLFSILSIAKKIPVVYHIHTAQVFLGTGAGSGVMNSQDQMIKTLLRGLGDIMVSAGSSAIANLFTETYGHACEVIPPPIRALRMPKRRKFQETKGVLWSSEAWKEYETAIEVFSEIRKIDKKIPLTYHIYGKKKKIEEAKKAINKIKDVVFIEDYFERKDLLKRFSYARIGLYTSKVDLHPLMVLEHLNYHPTYLLNKGLKIPWIESFDSIGIKFTDPKDVAKQIVQLHKDKREWLKYAKEGYRLTNSLEFDCLNSFNTLLKNKAIAKKTKIVDVAGKLLKRKKVISLAELFKELRWGDTISAHTTVPYLKGFFNKHDCDERTCYTKKGVYPCSKCEVKNERIQDKS